MNDRARRASSDGIAALVVVLGLGVMLGWVIHSPALVQIRPAYAPMQFNAALAFALAGLSCLAGNRGRPRLAQALAGGPLLLGGLTLIEYLARADFGIDQLFLTPFTLAQVSHPGRMGPNGALAFVLCGSALLLRTRWRRRGGQPALAYPLLAIVVACLGAVALAGYLLGLESAYGWARYSRMAVHAALAFLLLGSSLAYDAWSVSRANAILPVVGGCAVGLIVLLLWGALDAAQDRGLERAIQRQGQAAAQRLAATLDRDLASIERMRHRIASGESAQTWQTDAANYLKDLTSLRALQLSGRPAAADWTVLAAGDALPPAIGTRPCRTPETVMQALPASPASTATTALFVIESPLQRETPGDGCLLALIDLRQHIADIGADVQPSLVLELLHGGRVLATAPADARGPLIGAAEFAVPFAATALRLRAAATPVLVAEFRSPLPLLFLVSGLGLAVIAAGSLLQLQRLRQQARTLVQTASELQAEIARRDTLQKTLQAANRRLDDFAYIASHDLQEPLRGLNSLAGFLLDDCNEQLDDTARQRLVALQAQARRMSRMISDLLSYSRAGATGAAFAPLDMDQLLSAVLERLAPALAGQGLQVIRDTPLGIVQGERKQLGMVFECLIDNAAKYSDRDDRQVTIGVRPGPPRTYTVTDNGIGIPEEHRERVFRMFTRLHHRDEYGGGSGAGLSIARKIVEAHGGRLWVESRPDGQRGSVFCFTLGDGLAPASPPIATETR